MRELLADPFAVIQRDGLRMIDILDGDAQQATGGEFHVHHFVAHARHHGIDHRFDVADCCRSASHLLTLPCRACATDFPDCRSYMPVHTRTARIAAPATDKKKWAGQPIPYHGVEPGHDRTPTGAMHPPPRGGREGDPAAIPADRLRPAPCKDAGTSRSLR